MIDLKAMRLEKHLTLHEISQKSDLAVSQIGRYEKRFEPANVSLRNVCKIAKGFDVRIWDLIADEKLKNDLSEVVDIETGFFLDGEISPIAEIKEICDVKQNYIAEQSKIPQSQISEWEKYGMDSAKLKHFVILATVLHINVCLLIWDENLQNLFCEVL